MITLAVLMLSGCSLRCEPTGRILWSERASDHFADANKMVDGMMGGIDCDIGWARQ